MNKFKTDNSSKNNLIKHEEEQKQEEKEEPVEGEGEGESEGEADSNNTQWTKSLKLEKLSKKQIFNIAVYLAVKWQHADDMIKQLKHENQLLNKENQKIKVNNLILKNELKNNTQTNKEKFDKFFKQNVLKHDVIFVKNEI